MEMDKSIYSKTKLIVFKCLKTGRTCLNSISVDFTEEWIITGGGYFYNRKTQEQAEILIKRDKK
ncbi:hypothetical protein [Flavobacterium macacae]|uniref:Uncharacterized protein n=1 Tax=Flavobacterium macacae TaxID=2488993 RepID=A0A3P3W5I0_9FLAO|nr:hypothetical protein [Flavobacterium macacae]RRJ89934.1 hypothetical protein EG849_11460 [Flavobacterium macacae]